MAHIMGYHHLSLSVTDLERSTRWYRDVLGLEVIAEITGKGFRRNRLRAPDSPTILTLTMHEAEDHVPFDERHPGMDHVAFALRDDDEVHELKRHFEELHIVHSEVKDPGGGRAMVTLRDPDNIQLEVFGAMVDPGVVASAPPAS